MCSSQNKWIERALNVSQDWKWSRKKKIKPLKKRVVISSVQSIWVLWVCLMFLRRCLSSEPCLSLNSGRKPNGLELTETYVPLPPEWWDESRALPQLVFWFWFWGTVSCRPAWLWIRWAVRMTLNSWPYFLCLLHISLPGWHHHTLLSGIHFCLTIFQSLQRKSIDNLSNCQQTLQQWMLHRLFLKYSEVIWKRFENSLQLRIFLGILLSAYLVWS